MSVKYNNLKARISCYGTDIKDVAEQNLNILLGWLNYVKNIDYDMRNVNSDSHGVGSKRIIIKEREAKLAMNSTIVFCEYILSIGND